MKRRRFSSVFKTKVVLEALSERYTMSELADRHKLHPNQISQWKAHFKKNASMVFEKGSKSSKKSEAESERDHLWFDPLNNRTRLQKGEMENAYSLL
jgi:transposase